MGQCTPTKMFPRSQEAAAMSGSCISFWKKEPSRLDNEHGPVRCRTSIPGFPPPSARQQSHSAGKARSLRDTTSGKRSETRHSGHKTPDAPRRPCQGQCEYMSTCWITSHCVGIVMCLGAKHSGPRKSSSRGCPAACRWTS